MTDADPSATVIVKGNCGIPEFRGSEIHYSGTPELMSEYARLAIDAGAKIIGGCCGTSYGHLAAMRHAIDEHHKRQRPTVAEVIEKIGPMRNSVAAEQGSEVKRERRGRRG
jgi:5-methyltetrahydrofolate--homocysteine methyltransferase